MKLGMFDPPDSYAYGRIPMSEDNSAAHRQLSLQAARESMVLLKNENSTLPLKSSTQRIAVIGPTAELVQSLQGNYNGPPQAPVYPLEGMEKKFASAKIYYAQGSTLVAGYAIPIEHTALHPASGSGDGLTGEYFASKDLTGKPVLTRVDRNVNFNWDKFAPIPGLERNNYSVRWSGTFTPPAPGDYQLGVHVNYCYACENAEGFRLYVDGKLLVQSSNKTTGERGQLVDAPIQFSDTKPHDIRLEYLHGTGSAGIDLTWLAPAEALRNQAVEVAKTSDVVVAFIGLSPSLEGEEMPIKLEGFAGGDRTAINLPAAQEDLLKALSATGKPLVVVLQNGSALAINWVQDHAQAILEAWYPGEEGGDAIADTLRGTNNPAGRLPLTFYRSLDELPAFDDYSMNHRTYRYFTGKPLYQFGYGPQLHHLQILAAETFHSLPSKLAMASPSPLTSLTPGRSPATRWPSSTSPHPIRLSLLTSPSPASSAFTLPPARPGTSPSPSIPAPSPKSTPQGSRTITPGQYTLTLGDTQPTSNAQPLTFQITGTQQLAP